MPSDSVSISASVVGAEFAGLSTAHISPQLIQERSLQVRRVDIETGDYTSATHLVESVSCEHDGYATCYPDGSLISCKAPRSTSTIKHTYGDRGAIREFSRHSRLRLLRKLGKVSSGSRPLFFTLTYPGEFSHNPEDWKRDFDVFVKRLKRRFPGVGVIWRLEPQRRGAPHYHLLVWGCNAPVALIRLWCSRAWYDVVASGDVRHFKAGTRVERLRSWNGVMFYCAKYLGKLPELGGGDIGAVWSGGVGRWWGVRYPDNVPWSRVVRVRLFRHQVQRLQSAMASFAGFPESEQWPSLTIFCDGSAWHRAIESGELLQ